MDIREAINIAENLKNQYQAFEKIDEVLKKLQQSIAILDSYPQKKEQLAAEVADLQSQVDEWTAKVNGLKNEFNVKESEARKKYDRLTGEMNEELSAKKKALLDELQSLRNTIDKERDDFDSAKKAHATEITQLQASIERLKGVVSELKQKVNSV